VADYPPKTDRNHRKTAQEGEPCNAHLTEWGEFFEPSAGGDCAGRPGLYSHRQGGCNPTGKKPDEEAARDKNPHRYDHARVGLSGVAAVFRPRGPQEYRPEHLHEAGHCERPDEGQSWDRESADKGWPVRGRDGAEESQLDEELAHKPVERRQAADRHGPHEEAEGGGGHPPCEPTQMIDLAGVGGVDYGTGAQEQQSLEQGVVPDVKEGSAEPEYDPLRPAE
jgi:hypothetical protein